MESARKNDWLASQSLERSLDIISAINHVSIHSKLRVAGVGDTATPGEIEGARATLIDFLGALSELVEKPEKSEDKIAFGADPRLSTLARKFLIRSKEGAGSGLYHAEDLKELKGLMEEGDAVRHDLLVERLAHLRSVLEQHAQADAAVVFNEI